MFQVLHWVLEIEKLVRTISPTLPPTHHYCHHQRLLVWETETYII